MSAGGLSLADERLALRVQLQAQRLELAVQLTSGGRDRYPRSATMRLLLAQPELVARLVGRLAGTRVAGPLYAALFAIQALNSITRLADDRREGQRGALATQAGSALQRV